MQPAINQLKKFRERIVSTTTFNQDFAEFIAIEVFDFLKEGALKDTFYKNLKYYEILSENKDFNDLENDLFEIIQKILNLTTLEEVESLTRKLSIYTLVDLDARSQEFLPSILYAHLQDKKSFPLLKDLYSTPNEEGLVFISTQNNLITEHYKSIDKFLKNLISQVIKVRPNISEDAVLLGTIFIERLNKLEEKMYRIPKRIHFFEFQHFFDFCTKNYPQQGYESIYNLFSQDPFKPKEEEVKQILERIKKDSLIILDDFINELEQNPANVSSPKITLTNTKLKFYAISGKGEYCGVSASFKPGTKSGELLKFFTENKNTPLELKYIQTRCNEHIRIARHRFKTEKDVDDTIRRIRQELKVSKSEYFPLYKTGNSFILEEK